MPSVDTINNPSQEKVLLGVDEKFDSLSLQELITQQGYSLFISNTRGEICNALEDQQYDLILLDSTISGEQDFELIEFLCQYYPDIPVVNLTSSHSLPPGIRTSFVEKYDFVPGDCDLLVLKNRMIRAMERSRLEKALEESRSKFQNLVNHTKDWVWFADKELVLVYSSSQVRFLIGYEPEEVVGKKPFDFMPAEEVEWVANQFMESAGSEEKVPLIECTFIHREGHPVVIEIHASPMFDCQGRIVGYLGSNRDVTDRKQFEKALRKSEERFRAVFQAAEDYIFIKDSSFRYTHTNPAMEKLFNLHASELVGRTDADLLGAETASEIHAKDAQVLQGKIVEEEQSQIINDTLTSFHVIKVPLMDDSGDVIGICGIARDITERKRADQEREALQRLSQKLTEPLSIHELGRIISQESRFLFHHDAFALDLFDREQKTIIGIHNEDTFPGMMEPQKVPNVPVPISNLKGSPLFEGKPILINRQEDPEDSTLTAFGNVDHYSRSLMFSPIRWKDVSIGVLSVQSYTPNRYGERELLLLQTFADHLGGVMARIRAEEETQVNLNHLTVVQEAAKMALDSETPHQLGTSIIPLLRGQMPVDAYFFTDFDPVTDHFIELVRADTIEGEFKVWEVNNAYPLEDNPLFEYYWKKTPRIEHRKPEESIQSNLVPFGDASRKSASLMFAPMYHRDKPRGILSVQSYQYNAYTAKDLNLLADIANVVAVALFRMRAENALRESEEIYRKAISFANGVPYQRDYRDDKYSFVGEGITEITGLTPEEFIPSEWESCIQEVVLRGELANAPPEDALYLTRSGKIQRYQADFRFITRDGKIRWLTDSAVQLKDTKGQVWGSLGILQDITDRKKAEEEHRKMGERIQQVQKLESLSTLAGGVAHHFNNLLMAILGNADLVMQEMPTEAPGRECIKEIQVVAQRAAELSNQMLACSGRGKFVVERIDLSKLIEQMTHLLDVAIAQPILLKQNLAPDLPQVKADASQLRQLILNLVTNASEAIGQESGVVSITTSVMECDSSYLNENFIDEGYSEGLYVCLEISDTGCGMDKATQAKVFDPFFSTKFTGRGLGMAAVLGIVRGHQGAIRIYSELQKRNHGSDSSSWRERDP